MAETEELEDTILGELGDAPGQVLRYDRKNAHWQTAAQRRHARRRRVNQSLGECSVDLSGPDEESSQPGYRTRTSNVRCFIVLSVKFAPEESENNSGTAAGSGTNQPEPFQKPLLYASLLEIKEHTLRALQGLLAQIRNELILTRVWNSPIKNLMII